MSSASTHAQRAALPRESLDLTAASPCPRRSAYLALVFGFANLGLLVGTVTCLGGVVALQQIFFTRWAIARGFGESNTLLAALGCLTFAWPLWLRARGALK